MSTAANIKASLKAGKPSVGAWLTFPSAEVAECMADCGFDWLAVDMEHGATSPEMAAMVFMAAERRGVAAFARLPEADPYLARRLLDQGCQGLIVPVVENAEAFSAFAAHCFYPPRGRRGVGLSRCNGFGKDFESYLSDFRPVLVPQIETRAGVEASQAIAALAEVDALFLGPYDLSADLGAPGDFSTEAFKTALGAVRKACEGGGKAAGIHQVAPDVSELDQRVAEGFRFIAYGTDAQELRHAFSSLRRR
jgi:2-dehydro-3-deoxyglucarate aldolase